MFFQFFCQKAPIAIEKQLTLLRQKKAEFKNERFE